MGFFELMIGWNDAYYIPWPFRPGLCFLARCCQEQHPERWEHTMVTPPASLMQPQAGGGAQGSAAAAPWKTLLGLCRTNGSAGESWRWRSYRIWSVFKASHSLHRSVRMEQPSLLSLDYAVLLPGRSQLTEPGTPESLPHHWALCSSFSYSQTALSSPVCILQLFYLFNIFL